MSECRLTIVRCARCRRSGDLIRPDERWWCAWCQDWAAVEAEQVIDARSDAERGAVRTPREGYPLQPLRIPAGWVMAYNNGLYEIDPTPDSVPEADRWWVFKQDMFQMHHPATGRLLDLGWYPEGDLTAGRYGLVVHAGDFRGPRLHAFESRDRLALVAEIERVLAAVCDGRV